MSGSMTGGVDSSIPLRAGQGVGQQPDALTQIGKFASIQNALNQAKLFPGQLQLQGQAIAGNTADLGRVAQVRWAQMMAPILADPNIPDDDLPKHGTQAAAVLETMGLPGHMITRSLAATGGPGIRNQYAALARSSMAPVGQEAAEAAPAQGTFDAGPAQFPTQTGRPLSTNAAQITIPGEGLTKGLSPGEQASQVTRPVTDAEAARLGVPPGTPITEELRKRLQQQGAGDLTTGGQRVAPIQGGFGPNNGRLPPSLLNPNRAPSVGGAVVSGMAPGVPEAMREQVGPAQAMAQRVATFQTDMFPLTQAQQALVNAPSGRGSQAVHDASSYINTFAPEIVQRGLSFISPLMSKEEVAAYDEAKKYLTQVQIGGPGATRSNEGLTTAGAASPSTQISKEAAQVVLKGMIALRRMEQDEGQAWIAAGKPPADLNKFRSDFQKQADPRVYMFDQMTPTQRRDTLTAIKDPAKKAAFIASVQRAEQNGVLAPPGL